jgi:4-oxalocrotonate tautomerase
MPLVEVTLAEGRTPEQLRALLHELHAAVVRAVEAPPDSVRVVIREVPATHWSAGDVTLAERRAGRAAAAAAQPGGGAGGGAA